MISTLEPLRRIRFPAVLFISQPPGRRGESEKMLKCKICGSPAKMIKSNLGYFVECEKNGHIHNAGIYPNAHICKMPEEAEKEWDKFNK